jgi:alkylation response protein AidB-like acyl-CoA dehydrogenase
MLTTLDPDQQAVLETFNDLFDSELLPALRRLGERPLGEAGDSDVLAEDAAVGAAIWQNLAELGGLRLAAGPPVRHDKAIVLAGLLGSALHQGLFFDTVTAAAVLASALPVDGSVRLDDVLAGQVTIALADQVSGSRGSASCAPVSIDQAGTIGAVRDFVPFADQADHLLLAGTAGSRLFLGLVPANHSCVRLRRQDDISRGSFWAVSIVGLPPDAVIRLDGGDHHARWTEAVRGARLRQAAYLLGLCRAALDLTTAHARQRRQFGQSIGRFQAVAFPLAELRTRLDASWLLVQRAAWLLTQGYPEDLAILGALAAAAELARDLTTQSVQVHGALGMTEENEAQLLYRHAVVEAVRWGSPSRLRSLAVPELASMI